MCSYMIGLLIVNKLCFKVDLHFQAHILKFAITTNIALKSLGFGL